jgi:hypothetical protein
MACASELFSSVFKQHHQKLPIAMRSLFCPMPVLAFAVLSSQVLAGDASPRLASEPPRVESYDPITDKFRHLESTLTPHHAGRPGGDFAYYSTRLRQHHYLGRANTGGIYDAIQDQRRKVAPNPLNYQYRFK